MLGSIYANLDAVAVGVGVLVYGLVYFLFHEVLVHRRFPKIRKMLFKMPMKRYFAAIEIAHKSHHKHLGREQGESFGLLLFDPKHYRDAK
ncbi:MAG: hypothetical protein Kapaf2KO_02270 [Candidatus Kapaibacteriales bacterium]